MSDSLVQIFFGIIGGLIAYWSQHFLKSYYIAKRIRFIPEKRVGSSIPFYVYNGSIFPIRGASILVSFEMDEGDIRSYPIVPEEKRKLNKHPHRAFIESNHAMKVKDCHLPWAFYSKDSINSPYQNIWSKQQPMCSFADVGKQLDGKKIIDIPSASGLYDENVENSKSQIYLQWRKYYGTLKFISQDTSTIIKHFYFDPDDNIWPLRIW
jgi:hypothetical protein